MKRALRERKEKPQYPPQEEEDGEEEEEEEMEDEDEDEEEPTKKNGKSAKKKKKRISYTPQENQAMLDWLDANASTKAGNLFRAMVDEHVTRHSWISMRNHFNRVLAPLILREAKAASEAEAKAAAASMGSVGSGANAPSDEAASASASASDSFAFVPMLASAKASVSALKWQSYAHMVKSLETRAFATAAAAPPPLLPSVSSVLGSAPTFSGSVTSGDAERAATDERVAFVKDAVAEMQRRHGQPLAVVLHAIVVHTGDLQLADRFLGGDTTTRPWTTEEDALADSADISRNQTIVDVRGRDAVVRRIRFLGSALEVM